MPANYVLIGEYTTNTAVASITLSNIPATGYTDLKLVVSARTLSAGSDPFDFIISKFNGENTGYTRRLFYGFNNNPGTTSSADSRWGAANSNTTTANSFGNIEYYIPNYNVAQTKSISIDSVQTNNSSTIYSLFQTAGVWANNATISSIAFTTESGANFAVGTTLSLFGIAALNVTPTVVPKAAGGDIITNDGTYWIHTFLSSGTFVPYQNLNCQYVVIAGGGGGGGAGQGGGGGAGGYRSSVTGELSGGGASAESAASLTASVVYAMTIGSGGAGAGGSVNANGANGSTSSIAGSGLTTISCVGGGGGGYQGTGGVGSAGGSGGGAGSQATTGGAPTANQGYAGGQRPSASYNRGQGGGGAGAVGGYGDGNTTPGNGGIGVSSSITATATYRAGGGGGGGYGSGVVGLGGNGGGGNGSSDNSNGVSGTVNTGGGGGGLGNNFNAGFGGNGGSGIVIVRYPMA